MEFSSSFNRVFVTGDIHSELEDLSMRLLTLGETTKDDLLIILGDCGFFYNCYYDKIERDHARQRAAAKFPITILCIQGNHEQPFKEMLAKRCDIFGTKGWESNGIFFADNGAILNINGKTALVVGGAYSVDKERRETWGYPYWENEELSLEEFDAIVSKVRGKHFDFILSHTCPYDQMPQEAFLRFVNQDLLENRTECALARIKTVAKYDDWYCGHFHIDKDDGRLHFLFKNVVQIM